MSIDWKKEVEQRKDALLDDLVELLKVRSDREDDKATKDAPFGPGQKCFDPHVGLWGTGRLYREKCRQLCRPY